MSRLHRRCACPRPAFVLLPLLFAFTAFSPLLRAQNVVINEIMYHPLSHIARDEWVELHNRETTNVNVSGWQLTRGINFTFPSNTIVPAGGYLVVAAQKASFQALYPGVTNVVGDYVVMRTTNLFGNIITNWANTLSNTRDEIELENASGGRIDLVEYAEEGDWAQRQRGLNDLNHRGWIWYAPHDGLGHSLELRNAALPNEHGQNWGASQSAGGTPGAANSVATVNIPPMILDVAHFPIVPRSTESVSVTARILNESAQNVTVRLHWRADAATPPPFTASTMFDDGAHGDGLAGDGIYAFTIPAQPDGTVIEFYVHATDAEGNARSWPAPALPAADSPGGPATNAANALFQFDNNPANAFGGVPS
jgi:hypothetical protein